MADTIALGQPLQGRWSEQTSANMTSVSVFVGAVCVTQLGLILTTPTWPVNMHTATCDLAVAIAILAVLMGPAWGLAKQWACTLVAGTYTVILLAFQSRT